jgi:plasmid maintenance system antidote protein VapI
VREAGRYDTRGRRLLAKLAGRPGVSHASLARSLACSAQFVTRLVNGQDCPSLQMAIRMQFTLGIPVMSWKLKADA